MKKPFHLVHDNARLMAVREVQRAPYGYMVTVGEPTRSLAANAAQWPYLQAFADQLEWPVNGKMCKLTPDEWKDILTAAFQQETARLAMGLDGGVVMLGQRTSKFSKKKFSEWMEFLIATAADRGVKVYDDVSKNTT
jgi:hypothetical protein